MGEGTGIYLAYNCLELETIGIKTLLDILMLDENSHSLNSIVEGNI